MNDRKKSDVARRRERLAGRLNREGVSTTVIAGMIAPSIVLPDQFGTVIHSSKLLVRRPLVVFFFRALWCDYCIRELAAIESAAGLLRSRGAAILGVSCYSAEDVANLRLDRAISFPMLNDEAGSVTDAFGLKSALASDTAAAYGRDWASIPARFVIAQNGVLAYSDADPDYTHRPEPGELAPVISRILAGKHI